MGKPVKIDLEKLNPQIRMMRLSELTAYDKNPRTHSEKQVDQIIASIREFGFTNPILVDSNFGIIAGHGRLRAAKKMKLSEVPVIVLSHLTDAQRRAYIIADNKLSLNAGWDLDLLSIAIKTLDAEGFDLGLLGFSDEEFKDLNLVEKFEPGCDEDEVPDAAEAKTKPGDIYQLGRHRLMCGDSTSIDDVEKLMDGKKADMVFTDPPYNIAFSGTMSSTSVNGTIVPFTTTNSKHEKITNDKKTDDDFRQFIVDVISIIRVKCVGAFYISFSSSTLLQLLEPMAHTGVTWKSIIIWMKNQANMGGGNYKRRYEPIVYGNFSGDFYGEPFREEDIWEFQRTLKNDLHPTMKPIPLIEQALSHGSKKGQSVLDLFGGSGSTLIACEKTQRQCFMMEIDPAYCDVILTRWEKYAGQNAELIHG